MAELDRIDIRLISQLLSNGRMSHVDLAEVVHLSPSAIARRQRALEDAGVIDGYAASVSLPALGFTTTVLVHIALRSQGEVELRDFEQAVHDCPNVLRCFLMSGSDDYLLIIAAKDLADFERVHKGQLSRLPNVARIQSSFALREVLRRSVPGPMC